MNLINIITEAVPVLTEPITPDVIARYAISPAYRNARRNIQHPRIPDGMDPGRYQITCKGIVLNCHKNAMKPQSHGRHVQPGVKVSCKGTRTDPGATATLLIAEIMAYTYFSGYDPDTHEISYLDGDVTNCSISNLLICTSDNFRQLHLDLLYRQFPDDAFKVPANIHDSHTYSKYLVSKKGLIFSLHQRRFLSAASREDGYKQIVLTHDGKTSHEQLQVILVHALILQSWTFKRPDGMVIDHLDGDRGNNSLYNLEFVTPSINSQRAKQGVQLQRRQDLAASNTHVYRAPQPIQPSDIVWRDIGTLPWNSRVYSRYEVSSYGHVKNKNTGKLVTLNARKYTGYLLVSLYDSASGQQRSESVHRLVAKAFLPKPEANQTVVNHMNRNKSDNAVGNLEWTTFRENIVHALGRQVVLRFTTTTGSTHVEESSASKSASTSAPASAPAETTIIFFDSIAQAERTCHIFIQQHQRDGNVHQVNVYWEDGWIDATIQVGNNEAIRDLPAE